MCPNDFMTFIVCSEWFKWNILYMSIKCIVSMMSLNSDAYLHGFFDDDFSIVKSHTLNVLRLICVFTSRGVCFMKLQPPFFYE